MFKVGGDALRTPKNYFFSSEEELLFGIPKGIWISAGIISSFLTVELYHFLTP